MKLLSLLALGGAIYFFTKDKKSAPKSESVVSKIGSKEIGYEIINCTKLIIHNKDKAFEYAFGLGALEADKLKNNSYTVEPKILILGYCFEVGKEFNTKEAAQLAEDEANIKFKKLINTKEKAIFIFELYKYLLSGLVKSGVDEVQYAIARLTALRDELILSGYNESDFIIELKELK